MFPYESKWANFVLRYQFKIEMKKILIKNTKNGLLQKSEERMSWINVLK